MTLEEKLDAAKKAAETLFGDLTYSKEETKDALEELASDIEGYLMALDEELEAEIEEE